MPLDPRPEPVLPVSVRDLGAEVEGTVVRPGEPVARTVLA